MTDLDSTEIISADDSLIQNSSIIDTNASLKILSGTDPKTYQIDKETIIGRSSPSDLIIAAPSLSKQHAKITISNGQYFLTDLGSSNKTFHNKVQLQPNVCYALHDDDEIKFGDIICSFQEQQNTATAAKVDINPTTQTITDSYDNQEPTQPIKVWNGKSNDTNRPADLTPKQNGVNESVNKSSSSFVSHPPSTATTANDDDDDSNLIIGSTILPATAPLLIEPKELNNDDQLEIISSPQTKKTVSKEATVPVDMEDTPSPADVSQNEPTATTENSPIDTFPPPANIETSTSAICPDNLDNQMEDLSPRPASEKLDTLPTSELVEQLQEADNIADDPASKQRVEVTINQELVKQVATSEQMDTDETTESSAVPVDDEQQEIVDKMEDEVTPVTNTDVAPVDEAEKPTTMEQETIPDKSLMISISEPEQKVDESITAAESSEEVPLSIPDAEENQEEEEEEVPEESAPVSGRGHRGVARRNVRRARGRRGAAARARVVSTRIHGGRRNAILPPTINNEENNTTLEETVSTETEESPKKPISTPKVEEKKSDEKETDTPHQDNANDASSSNQTTSGSNVRVSARIKQRVSTGRNRQFPYTDDYVDLDDFEKQSKVTNAAVGRKSTRGRASSSPQKRLSLRQQPIDASENSAQKDNTDVYEQMDTATENKEPTPKTAGRKRKSTTPVAPVATKRGRPTTPQTAPTMNTRRKQTSTVEQSPEPSPTVNKSTRRTITGQQQATTTSSPTTPKRGRKPTKLATPTEQSPEKQSSATDRPVRIALSSHLNFDPNHLETLRKLGFEIMDESCQVDALVVDRIRRTKKFFMCLARGAHILSPSWIEAMIKENRYIPYEKYYLEDNNAETRYGFQLRESVRLAKQGPIFQNYKFFCTKDTSPPYDDIKDIIEAAGGKLIEKINLTKPGKDLICIVGQIHKNEYEDLFKKGVSIVSEEFVLSGISKQKLDFESFSLFQNAATIKPTGSK